MRLGMIYLTMSRSWLSQIMERATFVCSLWRERAGVFGEIGLGEGVGVGGLVCVRGLD